MQRNLPSLEMTLSRVQPVPSKTFDCTVSGCTVTRVDGEVDDTVGAGTDY